MPITDEILSQFKKAIESVADFYSLSSSGLYTISKYPSEKQKKYQHAANEWFENLRNDKPSVSKYPGLQPPPKYPVIGTFAKTNLANFKNQYINRQQILNAEGILQPSEKEFSLFACSETSEIKAYLERCRASGYGDCDLNALETAILVIALNLVNPENVYLISDQKWGHTFVKITAHDKCPEDCILDSWKGQIAVGLDINQYSGSKMHDGSSSLVHNEFAEIFIRSEVATVNQVIEKNFRTYETTQSHDAAKMKKLDDENHQIEKETYTCLPFFHKPKLLNPRHLPSKRIFNNTRPYN